MPIAGGGIIGYVLWKRTWYAWPYLDEGCTAINLHTKIGGNESMNAGARKWRAGIYPGNSETKNYSLP